MGLCIGYINIQQVYDNVSNNVLYCFYINGSFADIVTAAVFPMGSRWHSHLVDSERGEAF